MSLIDIGKIEKEAKAEIAEEAAELAKDKIVTKLRQIAAAEKVVANLKGEYEVLKRDIGAA